MKIHICTMPVKQNLICLCTAPVKQNLICFLASLRFLISLGPIIKQAVRALKRRKQKDEQLMRTHPQTIMFNEKEMNALNAYIEKYKIENRSKFMREAIISTILRKFDEDYPKLFDEGEGNLFSRR